MRFKLLLAAIVVLLSGRFAAAELMVAPTLEWLADHCVEIGVYRVTEVEKKLETGASYRVKFARKAALRGDPQDTVEELYYQWGSETADDRPLVKVGDEFLLCFQHLSDGDRIAEQLINLSNPQRRGPPFIAVTSEFKLLEDRKAIMRAVRDRLKRHPEGDPVQHGDYSKDNRVELDAGTEPYAAIHSGSTCYLKIPRDLLPR
jgi:hypothetical protein